MTGNVPLLLYSFVFLEFFTCRFVICDVKGIHKLIFCFQLRTLEDQYQNYCGYLARDSKFKWFWWCHCTSSTENCAAQQNPLFNRALAVLPCRVSSWELGRICGHKTGLGDFNKPPWGLAAAELWCKKRSSGIIELEKLQTHPCLIHPGEHSEFLKCEST